MFGAIPKASLVAMTTINAKDLFPLRKKTFLKCDANSRHFFFFFRIVGFQCHPSLQKISDKCGRIRIEQRKGVKKSLRNIAYDGCMDCAVQRWVQYWYWAEKREIFLFFYKAFLPPTILILYLKIVVENVQMSLSL